MSLARLLGVSEVNSFLGEYFFKLPYACSKTANAFCSLGNWAAVEQLLNAPNVDLLVASQRHGKYTGSPPQSLGQAQQLCHDGFTIGFRHIQEISEAYRTLAGEFRRELGAPVDVHLYCTPANEAGFGWHYDAEEVFILQTLGTKDWSLRKNTVNPWPLLETIPEDMAYPREIMPLMKCRLEAGDWLYIPAGYWHATFAIEESISLSIGLNCASGIDILDTLRSELLKDLRWRQRLPIVGNSSLMPEEEKLRLYRERIAELREDLVRQLSNDELVCRIFAAHRTPEAK
jgi:50S ribosomal protein L16 3-hydroxylase